MALSYVTAGTAPSGSTGAGQGTTSVVPDIPSASTNVGDLLILVVGTKPDTATIVTPTDWLPVPGAGNLAGGGGTTGTDTGPTRCAMFYRISNGAETDVTVSITSGTSSWGQVFVFREDATGMKYILNAASGEDTTTGSAWSVTASTAPGFKTDDHVLVGSSIPTDVTTPSQFSAEAITATGATFATMTELSEPDVTQGGDVAGFVARTTVTAGNSISAPVYTATAATTNTNVRGVSVILRIRSIPTLIQRFGSQTTVSTTAQTTAAVDLVSNTPVGALQIVAMSLNTTGGSGISIPSGWRRITQAVPGASQLGSYEHFVMARFRETGDAASVTVTLNTTSDWAAVATAYTGVYYQDISDNSVANSIPWQSWANTADSGSDALINTTGSVQNEYTDGWALAAIGERIASPSATSFEIRSTFPVQFAFTELADVASSGTTPSNIAWFDSNGGNVPISSFTNMFAAGTLGATSTEKISWWGTLRPNAGVVFDQHISSVSTADDATAVVSLPTVISANSLLLVNIVTGVATASVSTPSGWTKSHSQTDGACSHHVFWKKATGAEGSTVSITLGTNANWAAVSRTFQGVDTADPFIASTIDVETGTDTTISTTAITNTSEYGFAISAFGSRSTTSGATWAVTTDGGNIREHFDISSSISSSNFANLVATHSNTPVPEAAITFTGTGVSVAEKVAWAAILRPAPIVPETPSGAAAADGPTVSVSPTAGQPSATAAANDATVTVSSDVSVTPTTATATASADTATTAHTANAESAAVTGSASDAATSLGTLPDTAAGTGSAPDASDAVTFTAGQASASGTADNGTGSLGALAESSAGTAAAQDATANTAAQTNANAEVATASAAADNAGASVSGSAESAPGTAAANGAATSVASGAGDAAAVATGSDGAASLAIDAGQASVAASADSGSASLGVNAESSSGSAAANDATASTAAQTNANAESASATSAASDALTALSANAESAPATGAASDAQVAMTTSAQSASAAATADSAAAALFATANEGVGTASALDGSAFITVNAEAPAASAVANNATVNTSAQTTANAEVALATGTASDAVATMSVNAGNATASATANDAQAGLASNAQSSSATAVADNAAATVSATPNEGVGTASAADGSVSSTANAGSPSASAAANNATVTTSANANAPAGVADGVAVASDAANAVVVNAGSAAASATADNATASTAAEANAPAEVAQAGATASGATNAVVVNAGVAVATAEAGDGSNTLVINAESCNVLGTAGDGVSALAVPVVSIDVTSVALDMTLLRTAVLALTAPLPSMSITEGLKGGPLVATFPGAEAFFRSTPEGRIIVIPGRVQQAVVRADDRIAGIDPEDRTIVEE